MWDGNLWIKTFRLAGIWADLGKIEYDNSKIRLETSEIPKRGTGTKGRTYTVWGSIFSRSTPIFVL